MKENGTADALGINVYGTRLTCRSQIQRRLVVLHFRVRTLLGLFLVITFILPHGTVNTAPVVEDKSARLPLSADTTGLADTPWPTYQHDFRRTGRSPYTGITKGAAIKWQVDTPYIGVGGISVGLTGTLYLKTYWDVRVIDPQGSQIQSWPLGGTCKSTPTLMQDQKIYYGGSAFHAVTLDGGAVWEIPFFNWCLHSSPVITGSRVYFGGDDHLIAADIVSGAIQWAIPLGQWSSGGTPALGSDGTIYVSSSQSWQTGFYAFSPDGSLKWSSPYGYISDPAIGDDETVYSLAGGTLTAFDPSTGLPRWHYTTDAGGICDVVSPALASDGTIYFGTALNSEYATETKFYAVNPDGTLKWSYAIHQNGYPRICSSPIVDKEDNVYFCADNGKCYALDRNGRELWELVVENGAWLRTAMVIAADKTMYVAGMQSLYALVEVAPQAYLPLVNR